MRRFLLDLSVEKLYTVSALLLLCIIGNWWYFLYNPLLIGYKQNNEEINILSAQIERCQLIHSQCVELEKKYIQAKEECNKLIEQRHVSSPQKSIQAILNYADKAHLSLISYEMQRHSNDSEKLIASYTLLGDYDAFMMFLSKLEDAYLIHQITACTLLQAQDGKIRCVLKYECSKIDLIS